MVSLDQHLLFLINQKWTNPVFDRILATLACLEFWTPLLTILCVWLIFKRGIRGLTFVVLCFLGVAGNEVLISSPLKTWTNKPRPHESLENIRRVDLAPARPRLLAVTKPIAVSYSGQPPMKVDRGRSFPSSHTLNAVTLGLVSFFCFRAWAMLLLPFLMAWSRVYSGSHWPVDVLSSIVIGTIFTGLLLKTAEYIWLKHINRFKPNWTAQLPSLAFHSAPKVTQTPPP